MSDTDAMVKLMEHVADQARGALDELGRWHHGNADLQRAQTHAVAALAAAEVTLRMVAASVTPAPVSEVERREYADAHRDDIDETFEPVAVEPKVLDQVMSVRLPSDVASALRDHAQSIGQSASDVVRGAVADLLRRYKPKGDDRG